MDQDEHEHDRQRPAVTVLDIMALAPIEVYAVLTDLATNQDPAVVHALSDAVIRMLARTRL